MAYRHYSRAVDERVNWPQIVKNGTVKITRQGDGTELVSLGRATARGGIKHLGMFTDQELLAIWVSVGKRLEEKGVVQTASAA